MPEPSAWGIPFNPDAVPASLRRFSRWVVWLAAFSRPGKVDKHPRIADQPTVNASTTNVSHWSSYRTAVAAVRPPYAGVGYVLTIDPTVPTLEHLAAIDLDHCINDKGDIAPYAQAIVDSLKHTYWERSPSGTGLRGFFCCPLPGESIVNHGAGVEIYDGSTARYVTVTGQHLEGTGKDVATADPLTIANLFETYADPGKSGTQTVYAEMPEILAEDQARRYTEELAAALPERLAGFLRDASHTAPGARSEVLFAVCIALYGAGYSDLEVFSALHGSPPVWQMALEHRMNKEHKAFAYLWRECCKARARAAPQSLEFDDLGPGKSSENAPAPSVIRSPIEFGDAQPAPQRWAVAGYIPQGELTLLTGAGGTGKSLLALQLQTAMAIEAKWLGLPTTKGRSLGIYCEDGWDEIHRRQARVNDWYLCDNSELADARMVPRTLTLGAMLLMTFDNRDQGVRTKFCGQLAKWLAEERPQLLILDTLSDFFGGNENNRSHVTQFCRLLSGLAERYDCAIVLCGHPSQAGINSGDGQSGSTAWNNAVRSRLYVSRERTKEGIEPDPRVRVLIKQKANYSSTGDRLRLRWGRGVFACEQDPGANSFFDTADEEAEKMFLDMLDAKDKASRRVSANRRGAYAPRLFAVEISGNKPDVEARWLARFEAAMASLLKAKRVEEIAVRAGHSAQLVRTDTKGRSDD